MINQESRLFMEIGIDDSGSLFVQDKTQYEYWIVDQLDIHHMVFERVLEFSEDDENLNIIAESVSSADSIAKLRADKIFELPKDGFYHYQKIIVPTEDHAGQADCYADEQGRLYLRDDGEVRFVDFDTAFEFISNARTGNGFWFDDYVFTIYNLIKCYVLTEKQRIANWLKNNCRADCDTISTINTNADILMAAVTVLTYLISKEQFVEAYRLLNGLRTCNSLCKDFVEDIKGCGCGQSV